MSGGHEVDVGSPEKRKTLWVVLWLNVAIAIGFFAVGYFADSNALLANGLDNSSDAIVYALSLLALTRSRTWKRGAARFSGIMLLIFSAGVIFDAYRRFVEGSDPGGILMMAMAFIAGMVNLYCLRLLQKMENKDVNMRAATTFSFNDFISNGGIIIAGIIVMLTGTNWPDLVVGIAVACIALYGGIEILRDAHMDSHDDAGTKHGEKRN
ncbi:RND transporter [Pacificimonas flava]|jgi:cation diffusion facilitator family transporter|uniref:Cadmium, cobalt and zinc/H(+)-K(+) antiporter n=10 Tax=Sphingomonadales TaxID=204457 RepID=A0A0F7KT11_9SPHN|nr:MULTISPECIES: cation diffusion facilitator family transporter [Sphingomonadales]MBL4857132.1 cation transporter [Idiomarina sp.]UBS33402.1 cation diffusion facilitator family transporter [Altererythrobacter sp. N1]AKH43533.1 Cadmium, cobalt and zinc/H(+)-K(+) antiporter [Croceibacterium atlanticum]EMD81753.1 Cobalt-zinc-cadmium resistance protein CzcD [Pacificimonas flava]MBB5281730.1 cation diffusion facilitator family transporter [Pacificimonas flava]|tara:strand:- start:234 stop:863 length:630 start_codon:yes stop_codon:yes gene_type:complete